MTKQELAKELAASEGFSIQRANNVIDSLFDIIGSAMKAGESIKIRRFGTFTVRERKPKNFINPKTKQPGQIPKRICPDFIVSPYLKKKVEERGVPNG